VKCSGVPAPCSRCKMLSKECRFGEHRKRGRQIRPRRSKSTRQPADASLGNPSSNNNLWNDPLGTGANFSNQLGAKTFSYYPSSPDETFEWVCSRLKRHLEIENGTASSGTDGYRNPVPPESPNGTRGGSGGDPDHTERVSEHGQV
jgi:hypothetical protein